MPDALAVLREALTIPRATCTIGELVDLWRQDTFRIVCRRPPSMEDQPDLAVRVRGAFGGALALAPPPVVGRPDPFARPPPFPVLFGEFTSERSRALPKPFVIDVDVVAETVSVRLSVFGAAMPWSKVARDALIACLAKGISIRSESRHRVPFEPLEVEYERIDGLDPRTSARDIALLLRSPLVIRNRARVKLDARSLTGSLVARAEGLARWHGFRLDVDQSAVLAASDALAMNANDSMAVRFQRHSQRQRGRDIPVTGIIGRIALSGAIDGLVPYLVIGAVAHVGSHAGLGMGRYELIVYK